MFTESFKYNIMGETILVKLYMRNSFFFFNNMVINAFNNTLFLRPKTMVT